MTLKRGHGFVRSLVILLLLAILIILALSNGRWTDDSETVLVGSHRPAAVDGDSFMIGARRIRLDRIDAPEYRQICLTASRQSWSCGKTARTALALRLIEPGLSCVTTSRDQYARSVATCSTTATADIGAAQVRSGMAVSDQFFGIRAYGNEEDEARTAKRGLWQGQFTPPSEWRAVHPTRSTAAVKQIS